MDKANEKRESELTEEQSAKQDGVDNNIHSILCELAGAELEWDSEMIDAVRDAIGEEFARREIVPRQLKTASIHLPYYKQGDDMQQFMHLDKPLQEHAAMLE